MADSERRFSHISVSSDDDDEFVIEAGVPAAAGQEAPAAAGFEAESFIVRPEYSEEVSSPREQLEVPQEKADTPAHSQTPGAGAPGASQAGARGASGKASQSGARANAQAKRKDESYQPTTLEDLKGTPMSTMQKVIIALALVGVAVAVVYYVVFFG